MIDPHLTGRGVDPARNSFLALMVGLILWLGGVVLGLVFSAFPAWGVPGAVWSFVGVVFFSVAGAGFVMSVVGFVVWMTRRGPRR
jgi:hypothetical protein